MPNTWSTRQTLIQRAKDPNDETAWQDFVEYYKDFIQMVIRQLGFKGSENDDLAQETLLAIWKNLPKFEYDQEKAKFRTWLSRIVKSKLIDQYRKTKSQRQLKEKIKEQTIEEPLNEPEIDQIIEKEWEVHLIKLALKNLASQVNESSFKLFEYSLNGMSDSEIAEKLSMQVSSVNRQKNRLKKRLSQEVANLRYEIESC